MIERLPAASGSQAVRAIHPHLGTYTLTFQPPHEVLLTENETNTERLFGTPNAHGTLVKDAFHTAITQRVDHACRTAPTGTKCAPVYLLRVAAGASVEVRLRLSEAASADLGDAFTQLLAARRREADAFYQPLLTNTAPALAAVKRQAWAGVLWSKQYYHYDVARWLDGDPGQPAPPPERQQGRNHEWRHLRAEDVILMPDKWEYPWYAAWDLVFHCLALAPVDLRLAKQQCLLLTSTARYYAPDGRIPTFEYNFSSANPAVRGQSVWFLYEYGRRTTGHADLAFLRTAFEQLQPNYHWWRERYRHHPEKSARGSFLGLDNASLLDREQVPGGGYLQQVDSLAWLAGYTLFLLRLALELAPTAPAFEQHAIMLFEQFLEEGRSLNDIAAAWQHDPALRDSGFFYDVLVEPNGQARPIALRSIMGLTPLYGQLLLEQPVLDKLPAFRQVVAQHQTAADGPPAYPTVQQSADGQCWLLALLPRQKVEQLLPYLFNEAEMLAPGGIRSLSKAHEQPVQLTVAGQTYEAHYAPGEANTQLLGGNSNWRGPVWLPLNFLLLLSLQQLARFYGPALTVELPHGSGKRVPLSEAADHLRHCMQSIFLPDAQGRRPLHGAQARYATDPHFRDLLLFYEYFDGDTSRGCGASHQTGWTALVTLLDHLNV